MYDSVSAATAAEHRHELAVAAGRDRLARLATCCKPGALHRQATAFLHWLRAGQLRACTTC